MEQSASLASSKPSESSHTRRRRLARQNPRNTTKTTGLLEFQGFNDVVERASDWYRQICGYRVVSMETVQFKFRDRDPASSSSSSGEAKGERSLRWDEDGTRLPLSAQKHYYGDGLRVWLFPCEAHINGGVELGYLDLVPQLVERPAGCVRYETVPDLLERGDGFGYFQLFSLRVFFYRGLPTRERIQIRDVVPKPLDDYAFEEFPCVLKRASQWLQSESPLKLYNLQTLFVKAKIDVPPGTALSRKVRTLVRYLKVLRIVYSTFPESAADFASLRSPRCMSHRVFMPALTRDGRDLPVAEAIRALKADMSLWSVGLRGNILCAESLTVDYDPSGRGPSKINASAPSKSEIMAATNAGGAAQRRARVVLYFRVYTDAPEPVQKAAAPPSTSVSQPRMSANSGALSSRSIVPAVTNRKCRIM
ncbi:hypothetical protein MRX96_024632 [Rhipicephalus microplus]